MTFDFIIIAFSIFMLVKGINALNKKKEEAPAAPAPPPADIQLLTEIRDLLKDKKQDDIKTPLYHALLGTD